MIIDADYLLMLAALLHLEPQAEEKRSCSKSPGLEDELTLVVEEEPRQYSLAVAGAEVQTHYNLEE